jgi:hypothetical protein
MFMIITLLSWHFSPDVITEGMKRKRSPLGAKCRKTRATWNVAKCWCVRESLGSLERGRTSQRCQQTDAFIRTKRTKGMRSFTMDALNNACASATEMLPVNPGNKYMCILYLRNVFISTPSGKIGYLSIFHIPASDFNGFSLGMQIPVRFIKVVISFCLQIMNTFRVTYIVVESIFLIASN